MSTHKKSVSKRASTKGAAPAKGAAATAKAVPAKAAASQKRPAARGKARLAAPASPPAPSPAPAGAAPPFITQDPAAAFAHFKGEAQGIAAPDTKQLNVDPDIVLNNVQIALAAFKPIQGAVVAVVPSAPVDRFLEIPSLALAVMYASDQVIGQASTGEIASRIASLAALRTPMLTMLEVLASPPVGLADAARVKAIRAGTGPLDRAHDAVNIAAYFDELGASIANKHPFTPAQLSQLAESGQWLVQQLSPSGAVAAPNPTDPAAVIRDQLWTLLSTRYDALRAACATVLGFQNLDQHLPALGTRVVHKKTTATTPANGTPPATATTPAATAPAAPGK
jgi:hypothetical protein